MDEVVFGHPAAEAIVAQMDRLGAVRAFLMVSGTLNRNTSEIEKIRKALGARCVATFDAMPPHTPREAVIAAAEQARNSNADLVVTVGGGSIADGEFSAIAGVTNARTKVKEMLRHELVMPRAVILDPAITVHTPERLFLSTGIRAVDHCVEGICSLEAHPYADAQALKGLSMLAQALPRVKANPSDLDARMECQIGTWLSMAPLSAGVPMGASHGIGYVLGAVFDVPHGYTSCVMLPSVMRWNQQDNAERQALVSEAMGQPGKDAGDVLDDFIRRLGMPRSLKDVRIGPEHFDQ